MVHYIKKSHITNYFSVHIITDILSKLTHLAFEKLEHTKLQFSVPCLKMFAVVEYPRYSAKKHGPVLYHKKPPVAIINY